MTDVFGMYPHFDTNNNQAANSANNFQSNRSNTGDKAMLQLNNYSSLDYNSTNLYDYQDETAHCYYNNQYRMQTEEQSPHKPEIIHSGHFMVSEIDKDDDADNEANAEEDVVKFEKESIKDDQQVKAKAIESVPPFDNRFLSNKQIRKKWNIDYPKLPSSSLDALFKKLNLGNDSKVISPKWKQFTGVKIGLKAKIRVNNLIWRAWHIKYVLGRSPKWNPFPPQLDTDPVETSHLYAHRPEVMKMGKFLKINQVSQDFIATEYAKWRRYYKEIIQKQRNQMTNMSQNSSYDLFGNNAYDSSNDQFNMAMFNPINNYSSAQLGMQAEFMQPDFSYGIQPEFMDTFEEPCLQSFLTQKNSFLPTLIEEEPIHESPTQPIYSSSDSTMNRNYDRQQMQQVNQMNQISTLQQQQMQPNSSANYNYMNYQPQQNMRQTQQSQMSQMSYRQQQNYMPNSNLLVDQQNAPNLSNQQSSTMNSNQQSNAMLPIDQNQIPNNGQFIMPIKPMKPKIRSRSVSSLPQNQQAQLQRQHIIENASSLMEINNQPMLNNQTTFHNTTSNLVSTQQQPNNIRNRTASLSAQSCLSTQNSLSNLDQQVINERTNYQRRSALQGSMINQGQVMQEQNLSAQIQNSGSTSNYYSMNLNEVNSMNTSSQNATNSPLSIEYTNNSRTIRNQANTSTTNSSTSYYGNQLQLNSNQATPQQAQQQSIQGNQSTMNAILTTSNNYNQAKYQTTSNDTGSNLISHLLSTNNSKLSNATQFKRNSTGTYSGCFNQQPYNDQFPTNSINRLPSSTSSMTNLAMNSTIMGNSNVNTNLNSNNSSALNTSEINYATGQMIRKSNLQSTNQSFTFNNPLGTNAMARSQQLPNQSSMGNDLVHQSTCKHSSSSLTSSQENPNKNLSTKSQRIKREHRKLSTGKMRHNSSSLSRSNSTKSINTNSTASPTASLQSTLLNQASGKQLNNEFLGFDRSSNLLLANNSNLNANSSPLSPTLQSPLANSSFTSTQAEYYHSLGMLDATNSQSHKSTIKSASQSPNTSSSNLSTSPSVHLIKHERDPNLYREHRRVCHINAEQKRRCNIKHGFDTLRAILPSISTNNNTKISKASMLQKGVEHIRQLRIEHENQNAAIEKLRAEIETLNQNVGIFLQRLPSTGAPISSMRSGQIKERFESYVRDKTQQNWKFWMFSIIMEALLESYNNSILTTNFDELSSSVLRWLDQSCSLINLRREVLNSLRIISTTTNVLTDPQTLRQESLLKVIKKQSNKKK